MAASVRDITPHRGLPTQIGRGVQKKVGGVNPPPLRGCRKIHEADCQEPGSAPEPNARQSSRVELPDLLYFTGDPVFQTLSPASRGEAAGKNKSPVFC